jgi:hypothetical protein
MQLCPWLGVLMSRVKIDPFKLRVSVPPSPPKPPRIDHRSLSRPRAKAPDPVRYQRAVTIADAAMLSSAGYDARSARRCAIVVSRALDTLDTDTSLTRKDAIDAATVILARCETCARCSAA